MNPVNHLLFHLNVECSNEYATAAKLKYAIDNKLFPKTQPLFHDKLQIVAFFLLNSTPPLMLTTRF